MSDATKEKFLLYDINSSSVTDSKKKHFGLWSCTLLNLCEYSVHLTNRFISFKNAQFIFSAKPQPFHIPLFKTYINTCSSKTSNTYC